MTDYSVAKNLGVLSQASTLQSASWALLTRTPFPKEEPLNLGQLKERINTGANHEYLK